MTTLGLGDIDRLSLGASALGSGGGGEPYLPTAIAREALRKHGSVELIKAADVASSGVILPVGLIGTPTALIENFCSPEQFHTLRDACERTLSEPVAAVMPLAIGGMSTLISVAVAAEVGLPVVDADAIGRTFSEITMTLLHLAGVSASPVMLVDAFSNVVQIDTTDNTAAARIAAGALSEMGYTALFCAYPIPRSAAVDHCITGSVTRCLELGSLLTTIAKNPEKMDSGISAQTIGGAVIFTGNVVEVSRYTRRGQRNGTMTLQHSDNSRRLLRLDFQAENLVALENGIVTACVPDLLCLIDAESMIPITSDDIEYGQHLHVIALPSDARWRTEAGLAMVGPREFGYALDYRHYAASPG